MLKGHERYSPTYHIWPVWLSGFWGCCTSKCGDTGSLGTPIQGVRGGVIALGPKKFNCFLKMAFKVHSFAQSYLQQLRLYACVTCHVGRANITILILSFHCVLLSCV